MRIEQAWLLKGFVLAHDAPAEIVEAAEAAVNAMAGAAVRISGAPTIRPDHTSTATVTAAEPAEAASPQVHSPTGEPEGPSPADEKALKPRKPWSDEARAAAAERMRARMAAKKIAPEAAVPATAVPAKPFSPVPPEKLIADHSEYAGRRDPGQELTDDDWPDIKARLAKSPDRRAIAGDYDVEPEDLNYFIESCRRRELRVGNFAAPSTGGA